MFYGRDYYIIVGYFYFTTICFELQSVEYFRSGFIYIKSKRKFNEGV